MSFDNGKITEKEGNISVGDPAASRIFLCFLLTGMGLIIFSPDSFGVAVGFGLLVLSAPGAFITKKIFEFFAAKLFRKIIEQF